MKQSKKLILLFCLSLGAMSVQADDSPSVTIKRLTLESANKVAMGAINNCRKQGIQVSATVVDRDGQVQVVVRDTLAPLVSVKISRMKAYTAANFTADTSAMVPRAGTAIGRIEGLVMAAGGNIIQVGGVMYGAVGVSGAPSGKTDEACAKAGIKTVVEDLEMAD